MFNPHHSLFLRYIPIFQVGKLRHREIKYLASDSRTVGGSRHKNRERGFKKSEDGGEGGGWAQAEVGGARI